jgi:large subunit ribosomal protein L32
MPVPKRKASKARRNRRKSANQVVTASSFMDCKNCNDVCMPHQVCQNCGFYGGKKVMETKTDRQVRRGVARKTETKATESKAAQVTEAEVVEDTTAKKAAAPKKTRAKKETKE